MRKTKLPGVISLRNDLPIWAMPNGGRRRLVRSTFMKFTKAPWAVSGRRNTSAAESATGPAWVENIRLNWRASVKAPVRPQSGQASGSASLSARCRAPQPRQSTSGSLKFWRWPEASNTAGGDRIDASRPTTSWRSCTIERHHCRLTLPSSSTPRGP